MTALAKSLKFLFILDWLVVIFESTSLFVAFLDKLISFISKNGPSDFEYNYELEIISDKTPETWSKKLFWFSLYLVYVKVMKIKSSLKSIKKRDLNSKLVRRRGRVYVINKTNPKFKARQK